MGGIVNRGWVLILSGCCGTAKGNSRRAPSTPHWPRAVGRGGVGQCDWGSENAGMKTRLPIMLTRHSA